ncbi:hypothetical protein EIN_399630 [Entamoeba invadens IP1]|uniref:Flavodoxin-like domain-containing protein n=1 Tax=Entamoeba invadens IP1 TaxID=370355 RepID=A0A0A1UA46_ENTIV|nr:hypothetical protein EIN_399630 [Entamoeba invadens IP1]ELP91923.1 hypothetical protein EIN_399630 [Entamoeba invadens IP1]|eukprot:XP_004258694.1 hypothetical protein EIN_399630 [Entamoeba invadens IP1]
MSDEPKAQQNVLIIYFTRDGHSEKIAQDLHAAIPSDIIKVQEKEEMNRGGVMNYLYSFNESYFGSDNSSLLKTENLTNTEHYKSFIFIGPVWWWGINGPLKNACKEILKTVTPSQHVFLALSFRGKMNPGDKGSFDEFKKLFTSKAIVHDNYLRCQEDDYASGAVKEQFDAFVVEIKKALE